MKPWLHKVARTIMTRSTSGYVRCRRWWRGERGRPGEFAPQLRPIVVPIVLFLIVVAVISAWIYRFIAGQDFTWLPWPIPSPHLTDPDKALKATAGILALMAAVLTAVYAYRKQLLTESEAKRADALDFARR
ncbi:MAG: pentapeptide repeat-containing protein, partial [Actinomycetota bacterium]|nr:pentapeptide repeat-containing protein [Actinomycetota bacterium]